MNTNTVETKKCSLCGHDAVLRYRGMKSYIEGSLYNIFCCPKCETSFVDPLRSDKKIYEYIYRQADQVPGYERYYRYFELVKKSRQPLSLLSNSESVYWAVEEALNKYFPKRSDISVLEIGSGLGYLTYALNKAGYKTTGLDISNDAVRQAREKFGDYYEAGDLFILAREKKRTFDCVIMTEIIEHVEDPRAFIVAALSLLKPNGKLIVTTPNKSAAQKDEIWQSDFPPVHLWFFSEKTIAELARSLNRKCEFIDFTDYTKKFYGPSYCATIDEIQVGLPRLTKEGKVRPGTEANHLKTKLFGRRGRWYLSYLRRRLKKKLISNRTTTLCAVIF